MPIFPDYDSFAAAYEKGEAHRVPQGLAKSLCVVEIDTGKHGQHRLRNGDDKKPQGKL